MPYVGTVRRIAPTYSDRPGQQTAVMPRNWQERLNTATTEGEVVAVVRDYVGGLSPGDIERLPEPCRPRKFDDADDVASFALALVRHDCMTDGAATRLVLRLSDFLGKATVRLAQISPRQLHQPIPDRL